MGRINGSIATSNSCSGACLLHVPHSNRGQGRDEKREQLNVVS